jgi:hypothetical protein
MDLRDRSGDIINASHDIITLMGDEMASFGILHPLTIESQTPLDKFKII